MVMVRFWAVFAVLLAVYPVRAQDVPETPGPQPMPPEMPQEMPQQMPRHLTQPRADGVMGNQEFLLQCRTNRSDVIFLMDPDVGLVENVSSFPKMTGALFVSDLEYVLVFTGQEVSVPVEFVISRYTGRLTAVADGTTVLFTGVCRKSRAKALF